MVQKVTQVELDTNPDNTHVLTAFGFDSDGHRTAYIAENNPNQTEQEMRKSATVYTQERLQAVVEHLEEKGAHNAAIYTAFEGVRAYNEKHHAVAADVRREAHLAEIHKEKIGVGSSFASSAAKEKAAPARQPAAPSHAVR